MPTAGKSTIAKKLAEHFGLPWMSSDQIREIMKSAIDPTSNSPLNGSVNMSAESYFNKFTPQQIAEIEYRQGLATWPGISFMINNDWTWRDGFILEGVNILPKLVNQEQDKHTNIQAIFLTDSNTERTKDVILTRGLYAKADSYPDELKDQELKWVKIFDEIVKKEAEDLHFPIIEISKSNDDIDRILTILN